MSGVVTTRTAARPLLSSVPPPTCGRPMASLSMMRLGIVRRCPLRPGSALSVETPPLVALISLAVHAPDASRSCMVWDGPYWYSLNPACAAARHATHAGLKHRQAAG